MSATSRQRLAREMRWTARVIGLGETAFLLFFVSFAARIFTEGGNTSAITNFSVVAAVITLAVCFISWWREWLAGVLLIISCLTPLGVVIYREIVMGRHYWQVDDWLGWLVFASALPVAGLLFLLSWWLSRKTA